MVDTEHGAGGVRAAVRAHRLMAFGALVVLLTLGPVALQLDKLTMPFVRVYWKSLAGGPGRGSAVPAAASKGLTPLSRSIDPLVVWQLQGIMVTILAIVVVVLSVHLRRQLGGDITPAGEPNPPTAPQPAATLPVVG